MSKSMMERLRPLQYSLEQKILAYAKTHILELEIFAMGIFIMAVIGKTPYINILIPKQISLLLLIIFAVYLFQIKKRILLIFSLFMYASALVATLAGKLDSAEFIGTIIYALLWFMSVLYLKDAWRSL